MTASHPAFSLVGVDVVYGGVTAALAGISVTIAQGEAVAIVGPSGAGKTTLLSLLNGSVRPARGRVFVTGRPIDGMSERELRRMRAGIGFVHQDLRLVPNIRVIHNVIAGRLGRMSLAASIRAHLLLPRALQRDVHDILELVGIGDKLHERTDRLSGGQRQRAAIARALFQQPTSLVADEPVASVDPARAHDAVQLLLRVSREAGLTLCVSLHDLALARACFPRLIGLRDGRMVFDQSPATLQDEQLTALYALGPDATADDEA